MHGASSKQSLPISVAASHGLVYRVQCGGKTQPPWASLTPWIYAEDVRAAAKLCRSKQVRKAAPFETDLSPGHTPRIIPHGRFSDMMRSIARYQDGHGGVGGLRDVVCIHSGYRDGASTGRYCCHCCGRERRCCCPSLRTSTLLAGILSVVGFTTLNFTNK